MRLKEKLVECEPGEVANWQAKASVKVGIKHHIFTILRCRLDLPGGRDTHLDAVWDLSPPVKPKDMLLRDCGALPNPSEQFFIGRLLDRRCYSRSRSSFSGICPVIFLFGQRNLQVFLLWGIILQIRLRMFFQSH